jgi:hypothetical protein
MAKSRVVNFLYNPSSINSAQVDNDTGDEVLNDIHPSHFYREKLHRTQPPDAAYLIRDADFRILEALDAVRQPQDDQAVLDSLGRLGRLVEGVSLAIRLSLLKEFSAFLEGCARQHGQSKQLFQACLQVLIEIKKQMDGHDQPTGAVLKSEWIELEKSIYHLTLWEGQFEHARLA